MSAEENKISWSDTQKKIITSRNENVLVSAGAGAGKTAVLVEKIVRSIMHTDNPLNIDELLVVTFTEKAALEMKERITRSLTQILINDPSNKRVKAQLMLINKANISTIHSFCNELLRKYFYLLDLDPDFGICGEHEVELIKDEVLENYLEEMYEEGNELFFKTVDYYGGSLDDTNLKEIILNLHEFSKSHPNPESWLNDVGEYFEMNDISSLRDSKYFHDIVHFLEDSIDKIINIFEKAIEKSNLSGGPYHYSERLEEENSIAKGIKDKLKNLGHWDHLQDLWLGFIFKKLPPIKKDDPVDDDLKEEVKRLRDKAKKEINTLKERYFLRSENEIIKELKTVSPYMKLLTGMVIEFDKRYLKVKKDRKLLDYSDLEHKTLMLLQFDEVVPLLKGHYKEVMVDEYQDINGVQNEILENVCDSFENEYPYMFIVGDVKQSIYRFRLADPGLFLYKYYHYKKDNISGKLIELRENFRSSKKVIDGVNYIFENIMTRKLGGVDYDENTKIDYKKTFPEAEPGQETLLEKPVEVYFVEKGEERFFTDEEQEARLIAQRIRGLVEGGYSVYDTDLGKYRFMQYRDIVVLNRQLQSHGERITEIFAEEGVPFYAELNKGYFKAPEIQVMLSLLKIIDNPRQDIPLAAVLRSPIFGVTEKEMFEIRGREELYEDLIRSKSTYEKINYFMQTLNRWRSFSRKNKLSALIWDIYDVTGYLDFVRGLIDGEERKANLHGLYDLAVQFDTFSQSGLFRFLRYIEKLEERDEDLAKARILSEKEDVVRLMSIHKSKGLEFRVVFVMGLGKKFNQNEIRKDLLYHKELGLGPKIVDLDKKLKYPTIAHEVIKEKIKKEILAEEMRILYVALTRAQEHIILVGSGKELKDHEQTNNIECYFDWIIPTVTTSPKKPEDSIDRSEVDSYVYFDLQVYDQVQKTEQIAAGADAGEKRKDSFVLEEIFTGQIDEKSTERRIEEGDIESEGLSVEKIRKALEFEYPYVNVTGLPAKLTVTQIQQEIKELKIQRQGNKTKYKPILKRPNFINTHTNVSGAEVGTGYHLVFQHLPIGEVNEICQRYKSDKYNKVRKINHETILKEVSSLIHQMLTQELITEEQKQMVESEKILSFFETNLGERVLKNKENLTRELNFTLGMAPEEIGIFDNAKYESGENIVVQGAIDYLLEEDDGFLLIDFKTDNIKEEEFDRLRKNYQTQLNYYKMAVEEILKKQVKETYLYHIGLEKALKVN